MQHNKLYSIYISIIASISGVLFGYDTGVISGAMIFLKQDFIISAPAEGAIVSLLLFGATLGALIIGKISDKIGRKKTLIITGCLYIIGTIGLSVANSLNMLYLFRFVLGIPIGIASFATPSYISEISPKHLRGVLVSLFQLAIVSGILITFIANYFFADFANAWRIMFFVGIIPAIILLIGLLFLPESPRWLIANCREEQAIKILTQLRGQSCSHEIEEIKDIIKLETQKLKYHEILFNRNHLPVFALIAMIMVLQQFSGIDAIIYYAPQIFIHAGLTIKNSLISTMLIGVTNLIATVVGIILIDKLGRRTLMIYGSLFMAIALFIVAVTFGNQALVYVNIAAILCYICAFAMSTALVGWLLVSEVFPLKVRGIGSAIGTSFFWVSNILISFTFPILLKLVSIELIFYGFAIACMVSFIFCMKILPETKNISLEIIERNLLNRVPLRYLGRQ